MSRFRYSRNSFSAGVVSDEIQGNTEFESYNNGLAKCVNFHIHPTGGLFKRAGTKVVADLSSLDLASGYRLIPFVYSEEESYLVLVTPEKVSVYKRDSLVATLDVLITATGMGITTDESSGPLHTAYYSTWTATNTALKSANYSAANIDFATLSYIQKGNVLYISGFQGSATMILTRTGTETFTLMMYPKMPYAPQTYLNFYENYRIRVNFDSNSSETQHKHCRLFVYNHSNLTYVNDFWQDAEDIFGNHMDAGSTVKFELTDNDGISHSYSVYIQYIDTVDGKQYAKAYFKDPDVYFVAGNFKDPVQDTAVTGGYYFQTSLWSVDEFVPNRGGTIKDMTIFEGRTFIGGSLLNPSGVWGSSLKYSNQLFWFNEGADSTDAVSYRAQTTNQIYWLSGLTKLFGGTMGSTIVIGSAGTTDEALTPSNFRVRELEKTGSSNVRPIKIGGNVLFVNQNMLYEIALFSDTNTYRTSNLSLIGKDVTEEGMLGACWQRSPHSILWARLSDGTIGCLALMKSQQVIAWHSVELGGPDARCLDICSVSEVDMDYIWMIVSRLVNGETLYTLEYVDKNSIDRKNDFKQYFLDGGVGETMKYNLSSLTASKWASAKMSDAFRGYIANNFMFYHLVETNGTSVRALWFLVPSDRDRVELKNFIITTDAGNQTQYNVCMLRSTFIGTKYMRLKGLITSATQNTFKFSTGAIAQFLDKTFTIVPMATGILAGAYANSEFVHVSLVRVDGQVHTYSIHVDGTLCDLFVEGAVTTDNVWICIQDDTCLDDIENGNFASVTTSELTPFSADVTEASLSHRHIKLTQVPTFDSDDKRYIIQTAIRTQIGTSNTYTMTFTLGDYDLQQELGSAVIPYLDLSSMTSLRNLDNRDCRAYISYVFTNRILQVSERYAGQTLTLSFDGVHLGDRVVQYEAGGDYYYVDVGADYNPFHIAYGYKLESYAETLPLSGGGMFGSSVGQSGKQLSATLHVYRSSGGKYGTNSERMFDIPYYNTTLKMGREGERITRVIPCQLENAYDKYDRRICIFHDTANSFNLLSIVQDVIVNDGQE